MKKKCSIFALILLLALSFCTTVLAAPEYNTDYVESVIYDETELLGSPALEMQGNQTLPQLSESLGIDLRVDVLTQISYDSISDTAVGIYEKYDYGYGDKKEGATLTIFMEPQEDGSYAMPDDGWCVYVTLRQGRGSSQDLANAIRDAVQPSMAEQAWNGEDLTMSATALAQVVDAMAEATEDYILTNCPPEGYGADVGTQAPEVPDNIGTDVGMETLEAPEQNGDVMEYVFDVSGLLTHQQWQELESRAKTLSQSHHCGIYFALVDDFTEYGNGRVYEVTYQIYHDMQLGMGEGRDGLIVLLSMADRDYAMFVYGDYAEYAFNAFGQEQLEGRFLGDFGNDDWYGGISNYLDACDEYLTKAEQGEPLRRSYWQEYAMAAVCACAIAVGVCAWLLGSMKNVHQKQEADTYVAAGGLHLTEQYNRYTHTTESRRKIEKERSGGGGSTYSESGGGGSGRSGKF